MPAEDTRNRRRRARARWTNSAAAMGLRQRLPVHSTSTDRIGGFAAPAAASLRYVNNAWLPDKGMTSSPETIGGPGASCILRRNSRGAGSSCAEIGALPGNAPRVLGRIQSTLVLTIAEDSPCTPPVV